MRILMVNFRKKTGGMPKLIAVLFAQLNKVYLSLYK